MKQEKRVRLVVCVLGAIAATLLTQTTAYALTFTMNPGEHYAWVVKINNGNWIITEDANRNCIRTYHLGNPALTDFVRINGTSSWDYIQVWNTTGTASFCGAVHQVSPPTLNGNAIMLDGQADNDYLAAAASFQSSALGFSGNDTIVSRGGFASGESDSDVLVATSTTDSLHGGPGNDWFCLDRFHARAAEANGSTGTDNRCGSSSNNISIEGTACNTACLP
jgi:hypothetical protein